MTEPDAPSAGASPSPSAIVLVGAGLVYLGLGGLLAVSDRRYRVSIKAKTQDMKVTA